jgi:hypothetical protein
MKVLRFLRKLWLRLRISVGNLPGGIDSYKWENKLENRIQLSSVFLKSQP